MHNLYCLKRQIINEPIVIFNPLKQYKNIIFRYLYKISIQNIYTKI